MRSSATIARFATAAVVVFLAGGCSSDDVSRVAVKGTVLMDDEPLPQGRVVFVPIGETAGPKAAAEIRDGRFELPIESGPLPGKQRVEIYDEPPAPYALDSPSAAREAKGAMLAPHAAASTYNDHSQLAVELSPNEINVLEFRITSDARR